MRYYDPPEDPTGTVFDPEDDRFGPIMAAIQAGNFEEAAVRLMPTVYLVVSPLSFDGINVFASEDERDEFAWRQYGIARNEKTDGELFKTDEPICAVKELLGDDPVKQRLESLRAQIRAQRISYGEIAELQSLAEHIEPDDVELLEWAGVPEHEEQ